MVLLLFLRNSEIVCCRNSTEFYVWLYRTPKPSFPAILFLLQESGKHCFKANSVLELMGIFYPFTLSLSLSLVGMTFRSTFSHYSNNHSTTHSLTLVPHFLFWFFPSNMTLPYYYIQKQTIQLFSYRELPDRHQSFARKNTTARRKDDPRPR